MLKIVCTFAPEIKNHIQMKDKILNALKQEYAHLGLGDGILSGLAEMLAGTSLVTEENIKGIVAGQKAYLAGKVPQISTDEELPMFPEPFVIESERIGIRSTKAFIT